jgi:hypothetical protein
MFTKEELEALYVKVYFHNMDIKDEENKRCNTKKKRKIVYLKN